MKNTLKVTLVLSIVFSLLLGNVAVLATDIANEIADNQNEAIVEETNTVLDNETTENLNTSTDTNSEAHEELKEETESEDENLNNNEAKENNSDDEKETKIEGITDTILANIMSTALDEGEPINSNEISTIATEGKLYVSIDLRLPQTNQDKLESSIFNVVLKKDGVKKYEAEFYKGFREREDETKLYYTFDKVSVGTYVLEITGKSAKSGYVTYTQNVNVKSSTISELSLTNGHKEDAIDILQKNQIGVIAIGDVTGDGQIVGYNLDGTVPEGKTSNDEEKMIEALNAMSKDSSYDLNGDGKVDIVDLSYISINKNKAYIGGHILESVDITEAEVGIDETTTAIEHGEVKDILENNDKYVTLTPADPNAEISEENAVEITLDLGENVQAETQEITIAPSQNPENNIESGTIDIELDNGETIQAIIKKPEIGGKEISKVSRYASSSSIKPISTVYATIEPDGTISVDLGKKVAVKKITIKVTATKSNKFADIAKVEFLNGNVDRIPAPELAIPKITGFDASTGESFTVTWENMVNVTGYEVKIRAVTKKDGEQTEVYSVDGNSITISDFHGGIKDNIPATYYVSVQSVNGEWRSGYSDETAVEVKAVKKPGKPDYVTVKGGVKKLEVSWKKMNATDSYRVYYRKYNEGDYIEATKGMTLTEPKITIENLEDSQRYQVYVIGVNSIGDSDPSEPAVGETSNILPAIMPKYKLINTPKGEGELTSHILNATKKSMGEMKDSPLDTDDSGNIIAGSAKGAVDNDYTSYFYVKDYDFGGHYPDYNNKGIEVTFDKAYEMYYFTFAQIENIDTFSKANIYYKNMDTNKIEGPVPAAQVIKKTGENGRDYFVVKLDKPIKSDKVLITVGRPYSYVYKITIAELCFYEYDSLEHDIYNLYDDQMHTTLKSSVTKQTLEDLQRRLDTKDEASGEYHPEKESLQKELDLAKVLLENPGLNDVIKIDTTVTKQKDGHITFSSGLNAWQPLGVVGSSNKTIKVYVGNPNKQNGDATNLDLIMTQYYPQADKWYKVARTALKVGLNEITLPEIDSLDKESGGSLYIEYKGNNASEVYGVRVDGGEKIPILDLTKIDRENYNDDTAYENARKDAVKKYVEELETTVNNLESAHNKHKSDTIKELNYEYNEKHCILGATEIVLDQMMYSVSSKQIYEGLKDASTIDEKANKLYDSLVAMEDMVDLFYSHKGLNKDTTKRDRNTYPSSRLNIRYHQMFDGAAMYAGGLHIGIDWGDVPTLSKGVPMKTDDNGKYQDGNYFGWGIAHEIGHIINESAYVHGEVTNNYFSVLSQAEDTNTSVRFQYPEVYKKVMSGKTGKAQNVFTQLGLYWQLHLAYDKGGYNFKTYNNYDEQQQNLIFARMDSYARTPSLAPKAEKGGIELKLLNSGNEDNRDNNLMRLACAATQKDILEFFRKWGMVPNEDTIKYAAQWDKEDRAIYFVNDEARAYELSNGQGMSEGTTVSAVAKQVTEQNQEAKQVNTNRVELTLSSSNSNKGAMLGYEVVRTYMDNDQEITIPVAFVTIDDENESSVVYTDTIETFNNRVFTYKITGYDKYLKATKQIVLDPIKVENDGTIGGKADWTITTNLVSEADEEVNDKNSTVVDVSDEVQTVKAVSELADNNYDTEYNGTTENAEKAQITIELEESKKIVGFKYTSKEELLDYTVEVSEDGKTWTEAKTVSTPIIQKVMKTVANLFSAKENQTRAVYFGEDDRLDLYNATFIRFTIDSSSVSLNEIDLIGQTGDNVDFVKDVEGNYNGFGKLKETVVLGTSDETHEEVTIPAGSIVFTGTYKGNPAYNALKMWDENNELLVGSEQTFYADPLGEGDMITDVKEGIWVYWLEAKIWVDEDGNQVEKGTEGAKEIDNPMYQKFATPKDGTTVRAELYRVDDAKELIGERITSDTYRIPVKEMPEIKLSSNAVIEK